MGSLIRIEDVVVFGIIMLLDCGDDEDCDDDDDDGEG